MPDTTKDWSERLRVVTDVAPGPIKVLEPLFSNLLVHVNGFRSMLEASSPAKLTELFVSELGGLNLDVRQTSTAAGVDVQRIDAKELLIGCAKSTWGLYYRGGQLPISRNGEEDIATIDTVMIYGETIQVTVDGAAAVAEEALRRILVAIASSAGLTIGWPKLRKKIFSISWKVGVVADFGWSTGRMINPLLMRVLEAELPRETRKDQSSATVQAFGDVFVKAMGEKPEPRLKSAFLDPEITFTITIHDEVSGQSQDVKLSFERYASYERGGTRVSVIANTDHETLTRLLSKIAEIA